MRHLPLLSLILAACGAGPTPAPPIVQAGPHWIKSFKSQTPTGNLEADCKAGHALACAHLGENSRKGHGVERDPIQASTWYQAACEAGLPPACNELAVLKASGELDGIDVQAAIKRATQACKGGAPRGCGHLAELYETGGGEAGPPSHLGRARQMLEIACKAGDALACLSFARQLRDAVIPNFAEAARLFEQACQWGNSTACDERAYLSARGCLQGELCAAAPRQTSGYAPMLRRACDTGDPNACVTLGNHYESGMGVPANAGAAADLFTKYCDQGDLRACARLADLHRRGTHPAAQADAVEGLYSKACDGGFQRACRDLALLSPSSAAGLKQSCLAHDQVSCDRWISLCAEESTSGCAHTTK